MSYQIPFLDAVKMRRSVVALAKESSISDQPRRFKSSNSGTRRTAFHVQSCRAVVLFGVDHEKLWDFGYESAKETFPPEVFETLVPKIQGYKDGYGTVLFFEDTDAAKALPPPLQALFARFPEWCEQSNGMAQFIVWTALASEGLGCSLQHYQPGISKAVSETWNIPETWTLRAQLVFGKPVGPPRGGVVRTFAPLEDRVRVYGAKE